MENSMVDFIIVIVIMIYFLIFAYFSNTDGKRKRKKQINNINLEAYYRDIPCFQSISVAYWLLYNFSDKKESNLNKGLITAYLLKWYKNGHINITNMQSKYIIDLKDGNWNKNYEEEKIYSLLKNIAGNNNILEQSEIKNYCMVDKEYREEVKKAFESILKNTQIHLMEKNYVTIDRSQIILSNKMIEEYSHLVGLENFLLDYSNIEEKSHIEVGIWENYLIFANLLGITNKIKDQFKNNLSNYRDLLEFSFEAEARKEIIYPGIICISLMVILIFFTDFIVYAILILPFLCTCWLLRMHFLNKKVKEMNKKVNAEITEVNEEFYYKEYYGKDGPRRIQKKKYVTRFKYTVNSSTYTGIGEFKLRKINGDTITVNYNEMYPEKYETAVKYNYYLILIAHVVFWTVIFFYVPFFLILGMGMINK